MMTVMTYPESSDRSARWTTAEAKAKFSEIIEHATADGPQTITRNGRAVVVVVAAEEWEKKMKRRGDLLDFLASSPLRGIELDLNRKKDRHLKVER